MSTIDIPTTGSIRPASSLDAAFADFEADLRRYIQTAVPDRPGSGGLDEGALEAPFAQLALALFGLQYSAVEPFRRFCQRRGVCPAEVVDWRAIPALPTSAFKDYFVTSVPSEERTRVFHSSGTTEQRPSRHFHNAASLALYEASLLRWFRAHLAVEAGQGTDALTFVALAPDPAEAPDSSLAHMFGTVLRTWGAKDSVFVGRVGGAGDWLVDSAAAGEALARGERAGRAVCLVGTAFGFVHLLDSLQARGQRFVLPAGSRVLETGGYKGRSRNVPKADLHGLIGAVLGIAPTQIIGEYGMSELSSQAYDGVAWCLAGGGALRQRVFRFPPWARGIVVSPEDGAEVAEGETGLLRVVDLANVRSVMAIQTEDLAVRRGGGFELIGRAAGAEVRGCSLRAAASATDCWVGVG